jgi:hypothetical protein
VVQARRQLTQRQDPYHGVEPCHAEILSHFQKIFRQGPICRNCLQKGPKCKIFSVRAPRSICPLSRCLLVAVDMTRARTQ